MSTCWRDSMILAQLPRLFAAARQRGEIEGSLGEMSVPDFYAANCATCHGTSRQGGVGPALVPSTLTERDEFYFDVIANGRPGTSMPAWARLGLSDADIAILVNFLRTEP